ncbi:hypothetical protein D3C83_109020 [compost metagenome]
MAALLVCRVPNTRTPISAAVIAWLMVSRSRISPTRMTSGFCRMAARSAAANEPVCRPTSRCENTHRLAGCTNSIGSSMVTMWRA